jgi:hypothetical protein
MDATELLKRYEYLDERNIALSVGTVGRAVFKNWGQNSLTL